MQLKQHILARILEHPKCIKLLVILLWQFYMPAMCVSISVLKLHFICILGLPSWPDNPAKVFKCLVRRGLQREGHRCSRQVLSVCMRNRCQKRCIATVCHWASDPANQPCHLLHLLVLGWLFSSFYCTLQNTNVFIIQRAETSTIFSYCLLVMTCLL